MLATNFHDVAGRGAIDDRTDVGAAARFGLAEDGAGPFIAGFS